MSRLALLLGLLAVASGWCAVEAARGQRQSNSPGSNDDLPNTFSQKSFRISQPSGQDVSLKCGKRKGPKPNTIIWQYKRCGSWKDMLPCQEPSLAEEWVVLPCSPYCKLTYDLYKATPDNNGIYQCLMRLWNRSPTAVKSLTTSYEVDISDNGSDLDLRPDADNEPDQPLLPLAPSVHVLRPAGTKVELQCRVEGHRKHVIWHYKQCSNNYKMSPCMKFMSNTDMSDWLLVTCGGRTCDGLTLTLRTPKEDDNGLYRCSLKRPKSTVVTTYELEIVEKANSSAEILGDSPHNLTVLVGQPASFQCRIFSKVSPKIMWFRQRNSEELPVDSKFIVYFNDTSYEEMTSRQVAFPHEIYLSKLVLPSVRVSDSGLYICVALNNFGMTQRQVYLTVLPKYFQINATESDGSGPSHHWLFLIPASLALIPVTVWLCCRWRRKNRHRRPCTETDSLASSGNNNDPNNLNKVSKQTDGQARGVATAS